MYQNLFKDKSFQELIDMYPEYKKWSKTGIINDASIFAAMRDAYCEMIYANPLVAMELDYLKAIAEAASDTAEWAEYEDADFKGSHYCTNCGTQAINYYGDYDYGDNALMEVLSPFCPVCGVRMNVDHVIKSKVER